MKTDGRKREKAELQAEVNFLLARSDHASVVMFGDLLRWTGRSSNALVQHVFRGTKVGRDNYPRDPSDLAACYRTVHRLPDHLKPRASKTLSRFRKAVLKRYPLTEMDAKLESEGIRI